MAPDGRTWEVYVSRIELPSWRDEDSWEPAYAGGWEARAIVVFFPLVLLSFVWNALLLPLVRFVVALPGALLQARRSRVYRIEAITYWPAEEHVKWETTGDHVERVTRQVAAGLARGELEHPLGATYLGSTRPGLH